VPSEGRKWRWIRFFARSDVSAPNPKLGDSHVTVGSNLREATMGV
jgi:hypothetical protein